MLFQWPSLLNSNMRYGIKLLGNHVTHKLEIISKGWSYRQGKMAPIHCVCDPDTASVNLKVSVSKSDSLKYTYGTESILHCIFSSVHFVLEKSFVMAMCAFTLRQGDKYGFAASLSFLILPSVATNAVSLYWLVRTTHATGLDLKLTHWVLRDVCHFMQLGTVCRYAEQIWLIVTVRKKAGRHEMLHYLAMAEQESALLGLMSAYLGSGPQLIMQVYFVAKHGKNLQEYVAVSVLAIIFCLISTAKSLLEVKNATWKYRANRTEMGIAGTAMTYCWYLFNNFSRALAFGLFTSTFPIYAMLVCFGHWVVATFWLFILQLHLFEEEWERIVFTPVIGVIYMFVYFKVQEGPTVVGGFIHNAILIVEGVLLVVFWSIALGWSDFLLLGRILPFSGYFATALVGYAFMIMYYTVFHPTKNKRYVETGGGEEGKELDYLNATQKLTRPNSYTQSGERLS